jgi:hypothetical protein
LDSLRDGSGDAKNSYRITAIRKQREKRVSHPLEARIEDDWYRRAGALIDAVDEDDALFLINFDEANLDDFAVAGLNGAADVLSFDGHFAVAAIDEHAQRDALGAAEVKQAVHGGANGAAGVKDVVDEDEVHAVHGEGDIRGLQDGLRRHFGEVVAIESDVQSANGNVHSIDSAHGARDPLGERHSAAADADKGQAFCPPTFLHNLVSKALQSAVDFGRGHQLRFFDNAHVRVMLAQVGKTGSARGNLKGDSRRGFVGVLDFRGIRKGESNGADE